MSLAPLHGIRACVFDAYGTLFDVAAAARTCSAELGEKSSALSSLWREKQLQYTWLRALQGRHADFWQVTGEALDFALETLRISGSRSRNPLPLIRSVSTLRSGHCGSAAAGCGAGCWNFTSHSAPFRRYAARWC